MFYRQKILLALVQLNEGSIGSTDLQKLLFLFCQETGQNHYEFFPHKFGPYSFASYDDKQKLITQGVLKEEDVFALNTPSLNYVDHLKASDAVALQQFMASHQQRGKPLQRRTYLDYPEYASRSRIVDKLLTQPEIETISSTWNNDSTAVLFTIGYEGHTIDHYLHRLLGNNVRTLVDVRRNPLSRKHGFSQRQLQQYVNKVGIRYIHLPELGISSHLRKNLASPADYKALFEQYEQEILPQQPDDLARIVALLQTDKRIALTCFEADHCSCHRHKIAQHLAASIDCPIVHI